MSSIQFYIYRWIRLDTNTPFYVGKGKGRRAFDVKNGRNQYFKNIVNSVSTEVEIVLDNLTEAQAFEKEIEFIKLYKNLGYCEANLSLGGEGTSGNRQSIETIQKRISKSKGKTKGNKYPQISGDKNPAKRPEVREFLSKRQIGVLNHQFGKTSKLRKVVKAINLNTQEEHLFESNLIAAKALKVSPAGITAVSNGRYKQLKGWIFFYINNQENQEVA